MAAPTPFDGFMFRSRTEARWAVFLKAVNVHYSYEGYSFNLPYLENPATIGTSRYTPDFHLPDHHLWIEVKGTEPTPKDIAKAQRTILETREAFFFYVGFPHVRGRHPSCVLEIGPDGVKDYLSWEEFFEGGTGSVLEWFPYVDSDTLFWEGIKAGKQAFRADPPRMKSYWKADVPGLESPKSG